MLDYVLEHTQVFPDGHENYPGLTRITRQGVDGVTRVYENGDMVSETPAPAGWVWPPEEGGA